MCLIKRSVRSSVRLISIIKTSTQLIFRAGSVIATFRLHRTSTVTFLSRLTIRHETRLGPTVWAEKEANVYTGKTEFAVVFLITPSLRRAFCFECISLLLVISRGKNITLLIKSVRITVDNPIRYNVSKERNQ